MPYFKDTVGGLHFLDDALRIDLLPIGSLAITDAEADTLQNPPPSPGQVIANLTAAVQARLDTTARTRNYDGILSLCSYSASTNPKFGPEGLAGVAWRDAVWATCYTVLAAVQAGTQAVPTEAGLLALLPAMTWPV
jgi:hypothetical protein